MAKKISAQGSTLKIGVTGAAKTVTAVTKANPGIFTSAAHGLTDGQVVDLAGFVGMTELNGKAGVVVSTGANTFYIAGLDTTNFGTYSSGGTATPSAIQVGNIKSYDGFDGAKSELDATDFDSLAKEFLPGLQDFGQVSFDFATDDTDKGQMVLHSNKAANNLTSTFVLTLPNGKTRTWQGFVKQLSESGQVDAIVMNKCQVRISGVVTRA